MPKIPDGYEVIPDGYEIVNEQEDESPLVRHAKDFIGGPDAALSMVANLPAYLYSGMQGLGTLILTGDINKSGNAVRQMQESNFGLGAPQPFTESGKQVQDMLGHGMEFAKEKAGDVGYKVGGELGRTNAEIATEVALNFLPLPGGKGVHALGKRIEGVLPKPRIEPIRALPEGYEVVKPETPVEGNTWMERQMNEGQAMDAREQAFADKNNVQGELDLRPKDMPLDENGMPVDMARSLDAQDATTPKQVDLFNEEARAQAEQQRAQQLADQQAREQTIPVPREDPAVKQQQMEEMYAQRQQELADAQKAEQKQLADEKQEELFTKLEDDLRAKDYTPQGDGQGPKTREFRNRGMGRRQSGAIDVQAISDGLQKVKDGVMDAVDYLKTWEGTFSPKAIKEAQDVMKNPSSNEAIAFMSPDQFLKMAEGRTTEFASAGKRRQAIKEGLSGKGLDDIPYLKGTMVDGKFQAEAHNGRHRMDVLKDYGVEKVPVRLKVWRGEGNPAQAKAVRPQMNSGMSRGQRGVIDVSFLDGIEKKGRAALEQLRKLTWDKYYDAKQETVKDEAYKELRQVDERLWKLDKLDRIAEGQRIQQPKEVFPGFTQIPSGTRVMATHGIKYKEPTMGTVVGVKDMRFEDGPYRLPVVDFGDGHPRTLGPHDLKEVFSPRPLNSGPGGRQGGAIDFEGISEGLKKLIPSFIEAPTPIKDVIGSNRIPADPKTADIVADALKEGKDTDAWNVTKYTESGGSLAAMSRRSALIQGVSRIVQNAQKRADLYIRKTVYPVEQMFRSLGNSEVVSLAKMFKEEMFNEQRYTVEQLEAQGLTQKQLQTYAGMRKMLEDSLVIQNKQREALGMKPITSLEHYMSSRWQGDYRQSVRDAEGRLVWYLAADSKLALEKQLKALQEAVPGLTASPNEFHIKKAGRSSDGLQSMYTTMVDVLGRDDPAVVRIKEAYEAALQADTYTTLGQKKHFVHKGNIRGFVGDRPGLSPKKEAYEMFQQQVQYAKNAYKWASMQEAGVKLKEVFSDEQLNAQQPKNVEYAKEYFKDNLGQSTAKWVDGIENAFRDMGISPATIDKHIGNVKSFFITQKLAVSAGYTLANMLQVTATMPHLVNLMVKEGGNPLKAIGTGLLSGTAMASGHYINKLGGNFEGMTKDLPFLTDAFKYAEDNGITSRSIYDESPINQRGVISKTGHVLGKTLSVPETFVRSMAYMTFVQMLKDTKKYASNEALFQRAEELTNVAMVDYRAGERPMAFSKMGVAGNFLNTLQTYPSNLYNQYRYFGKEAMKGNVAPLATLLAMQYMLAGAMGLPGFNDADKAWDKFKEMLPDEEWAKVKDFDLKLWTLEHLGEAGLYGWLSDKSGVSMTSRLSAPGATEMIQAPGGPAIDLAKQAGSVAQAVVSPNQTTVAQAVRNVTPTGLQGVMETGVFKDQNVAGQRPDGTTMYKKATDLQSRQGQYARTPQEETIRKLGLRSQKEVLSNDLTYKINKMEKQTSERSKSMVEKYYDAVRRGDMKKAQELQKLYISLNGKEINNEQFNNQLMQEYTTIMERKSTSAKEKLSALQGIARVRKIMENGNNTTTENLPGGR